MVAQCAGATGNPNPFRLVLVIEQVPDRPHHILFSPKPCQLPPEFKIGLNRRMVVGDYERARGSEVEQTRLDQRISMETAVEDRRTECR